MPRELEIRTTILQKKATSRPGVTNRDNEGTTFEDEALSLMSELEALKTKLKETDQHIVNTYSRREKEKRPGSRNTAYSVAYPQTGAVPDDIVISQPISADFEEKQTSHWTMKYTPASPATDKTLKVLRKTKADREKDTEFKSVHELDVPEPTFQRVYARPSRSSVSSKTENGGSNSFLDGNEEIVGNTEKPTEMIEGQDVCSSKDLGDADQHANAIAADEEAVTTPKDPDNNNNSDKPGESHETTQDSIDQNRGNAENTDTVVDEQRLAEEVNEEENDASEQKELETTKIKTGSQPIRSRNYDRDEIRRYMAKQRQLRQSASVDKPRTQTFKPKTKPPLPQEARVPPAKPSTKSPARGKIVGNSLTRPQWVSNDFSKRGKLPTAGKSKRNPNDEDWGPYESVPEAVPEVSRPLLQLQDLSRKPSGDLPAQLNREKSVQTEWNPSRTDESVQVTQTRHRKLQISIDPQSSIDSDVSISSSSRTKPIIDSNISIPTISRTKPIIDSNVSIPVASRTERIIDSKLSFLQQIDMLETNIAKLLEAPAFRRNLMDEELPAVASPAASLIGSEEASPVPPIFAVPPAFPVSEYSVPEGLVPDRGLNTTASTQYKDLPPGYLQTLPSKKTRQTKPRIGTKEEPLTFFRDFNEILRMESGSQTVEPKPRARTRKLPSFLEFSVPVSSYNFLSALSDKIDSRNRTETDSDSTILEVPKSPEKSRNSTPQPQGFPKNGFQLETADKPLQKNRSSSSSFEYKKPSLEQFHSKEVPEPTVQSGLESAVITGFQSGLELGPLGSSAESYRTLTPQETSYESSSVSSRVANPQKVSQIISPIPRFGSPVNDADSVADSVARSHSSERSTRSKLNSTLSGTADSKPHSWKKETSSEKSAVSNQLKKPDDKPAELESRSIQPAVCEQQEVLGSVADSNPQDIRTWKNPADLFQQLQLELHRSEAIDNRINQIDQLENRSLNPRVTFDSTSKTFFQQQTEALKSIVQDLRSGFRNISTDENMERGRLAAARIDEVSSQVRSIRMESSVSRNEATEDSIVSTLEDHSQYDSDFEPTSGRTSGFQLPTGTSAGIRKTKTKSDSTVFADSDNLSDSSVLPPKAIELLIIEESKQQRLLMRLREKAKVEKTLAELELLQMQKRILRSQGEREKAATLKKKQRGLLLKLQEERAKFESMRKQHKRDLEEKLRNFTNSQTDSNSWETDSSIRSIQTESNPQQTAGSNQQSIAEEIPEAETEAEVEVITNPTSNSASVPEESVTDSNTRGNNEESGSVPCIRIRTPLSPRTDIRMKPKFRGRHSSGSDDSLNFSQNETVSDTSDVESRVLALTEELQRRQLEANRLKRDQRRANKEKLRAKENSLLKQIEAYDRCISDLRQQLESENDAHDSKSPITAAVKPLIRQPRAAVRSEEGRSSAVRKLDLSVEPRTESSATISEEIEASGRAEPEIVEELPRTETGSENSSTPKEKIDSLSEHSDILTNQSSVESRDTESVGRGRSLEDAKQESEILNRVVETEQQYTSPVNTNKKSDVESQRTESDIEETLSRERRSDFVEESENETLKSGSAEHETEARSDKSSVASGSPPESDSRHDASDAAFEKFDPSTDDRGSAAAKLDLAVEEPDGAKLTTAEPESYHEESSKTESAESQISEQIAETSQNSYSEDFCVSAAKDETEPELSLSEIPQPVIPVTEKPSSDSVRTLEPEVKSVEDEDQCSTVLQTNAVPNKVAELIVDRLLDDLIRETITIVEELSCKHREPPANGSSSSNGSVLQRVSEILANNSPTLNLTKTLSPQNISTQLFLTTTFDLSSPEQGSPQPSPGNENLEAKRTDITWDNEWIEDDFASTSFGTSQIQDPEQEAEALERQQKRIEEEIQRLSESVIYMRDIPNKPPPPYTPPGQSLQWQKTPQPQAPPTSQSAASDLRIVCQSKEEILEVSSDMFQRIMEQLQNNQPVEFPENFENCPMGEECQAISRKAYLKFIFDLTHFFVMESLNSNRKGLNELQETVQRRILIELNREPRFKRENQFSRWARKRRDKVDEILIYELQMEDKLWNDFSAEEEQVKVQTVDAILDELLTDTAETVQNVWLRKTENYL